MPVLKVAKLGTPVLRQRSKAVDRERLKDGDLAGFIRDMKITMREYGGTGLAAPQVFTPMRILLYQVSAARAKRSGGREVKLRTLVNPKIEIVDPELDVDFEACLSVPFLMGEVARPRKIRVQAYGPRGEEIEIKAEGFHARVILHECDHLDGVVYLDRVDPRSLEYTIDF